MTNKNKWIVIAALILSACAPAMVTVAPTAESIQPAETLAPPTASSTLIIDPTAAPAREPFPADLTLYDWQMIERGFDSPIDIQSANDGSSRLFIVEKDGRIKSMESNHAPQQFINIRARARSIGSEQGLLGLAFHPRFAENGYFFVNYSALSNGRTIIARFKAEGDQADPRSEQILMTIDQPYANHNGGAMAFGPDGYLYIGVGDGGSAGDPEGNGQSLETYLGKILRINVDTIDTPYGVPMDNPFNNIQRSEIWAYGLRNPWRFSFDRLTGDMYIGDVGQNAWEEIDFVSAGSSGGMNFGWDIREGWHSFEGETPAGALLIDPIAEYPHEGACSVTGGVIYRGSDIPEFDGIYLYGDFCGGQIWGLLNVGGEWKNQLLFDTDFAISTFGIDEFGEVYLADYNTGSIYKLVKE